MSPTTIHEAEASPENPPEETTTLLNHETDSESEVTDDSESLGDSIWDLVLPRTEPVEVGPPKEGDTEVEGKGKEVERGEEMEVDSPPRRTDGDQKAEQASTSTQAPVPSVKIDSLQPNASKSGRNVEPIEIASDSDSESEHETSLDHVTVQEIAQVLWPGTASESGEESELRDESDQGNGVPPEVTRKALRRIIMPHDEEEESADESTQPPETAGPASAPSHLVSARRSRFQLSSDEDDAHERENERRAMVPHWDVHDVSEDEDGELLKDNDDDDPGLDDLPDDVWKQDEPSRMSLASAMMSQGRDALPRRLPPAERPIQRNAEAGPSKPALPPIRLPSPNAEGGPSQLTPRRSGRARHPPAMDPAYIQQPHSPARRGRGRGRGRGRARGRGRGGGAAGAPVHVETVEEEWHEDEAELGRAIALSQLENEHVDDDFARAIAASLADVGLMTEEQQFQIALEASKREHRRRRRASSSLEEGEVEEDDDSDG
ncbi:hypothetical protein NCC49_002509 [Naganishia albida]|nr:hypothetical protein NCC49_002509 [Naganishia albida]